MKFLRVQAYRENYAMKWLENQDSSENPMTKIRSNWMANESKKLYQKSRHIVKTVSIYRFSLFAVL